MYIAIVGSKLIYGLEVLPVTEAMGSKIDAFFMRGLQRILGKQSTYMDRSEGNTNKSVINAILDTLNSSGGRAGDRSRRRKQKQWEVQHVQPSKRMREKATALLADVLQRSGEDTMRKVTLMNDSQDHLNLPSTNRVGRPKFNWHRDSQGSMEILGHRGGKRL